MQRTKSIYEDSAPDDFSPSVTHSADDEAIMLAAAHDLAEFTPLYEKYVDPVYRYCFRRLGNRVMAEDATSLTFERAIKALPSYRSESFRAWLFTIARNTTIDIQRSESRFASDSEMVDFADDSPGPEEITQSRSNAQSLRSALNQLPDDYAQLIELRLAGLTGVEIARVLKRSHGSVRTAQYRALIQLRELMESEQEKGAQR